MSSQQQPRPLSHLSPVPADQVFALYDNAKKTLSLSAKGNAVNITTDIHFKRLPFLGGLLFELQGWVGPVTQGDRPYTITDSFNIDVTSPAFPSGTVVVRTANQQQWVVKIESLGVNGAQTPLSASSAGVDLGMPDVKLVPATQPIITEIGKPFTIQQADKFNGKGGSISVSFNKDFVSLTDAGITDDNLLQWTFTAHQTGDTKITVFVGQTQPPFAFIVPHNVEIKSSAASANATLKPTALFSVAAPPAKGTNGTNGSHANGREAAGLPLSWDGFVNIGLKLIQKQHPDAALYEVEATPMTKMPVDSEWGLSNIRIVARLDGNKTAEIQSTGWGEFGPVQVIDFPFLGDVVIRWPVSLSIHDAFAILRKAGHQDPVFALTLRQPLSPSIKQPFYIFNLGSQFLAVGVDDHKVQNFGPTGQEIQQS